MYQMLKIKAIINFFFFLILIFFSISDNANQFNKILIHQNKVK